MIKKTKLGLTLASASSIILFGLPNLAQAEGFSLEEIVVTAQKREESLQSVPVAVSSFSADDLTALNMTMTQDLAAFTPSVHIEKAGANSGTVAKVTIRGQVQSDNIITLDPSVGWYMNDVYMSRPQGTNTSMFDLERVEILKGPQGTLYGRNTTGGTIKMITKKADTTEGFTGHVALGLGNYESSKVEAAVNIPLIENKVALRVSGIVDKKDEGFQDVTIVGGNVLSPNFLLPTGKKYKTGTHDNNAFRLGLTWDVSESTQVVFNYEKNETDVTMAYGNTSGTPGFAGSGITLPTVFPLVPVSDDYYARHLNSLNFGYAETEVFSATIEHDINDNLSTKLVYGRRDVDSAFSTDVDGTAAPVNVFTFPFEQDATQDSLEWQIGGDAFDGKLEWLTGLYWFEEEGRDISRSGGLGGYATGLLYNHSEAIVDSNESKSAFLHTVWNVSDKLSFTAGARYTEDTKPVKVFAFGVGFGGQNTGCRFGAGDVPNVNSADCSWSNSTDFDYVSWTLGADYKINDDMMVYLKSASSSRAGGQNLRGLDSVTAAPFDEETATDIELGFKGELNDAVQLNVAAYKTDYEDIQQSNLINHPTGLITQLVNAGEATIEGIEVDMKWVVNDRLQFIATLGKIDWDFEAPSNAIINSAPEDEASLRVNYLHPTSFGQILVDFNASYRGKYHGNCAAGQFCVDNFPAATSDSVTLYGARVGIDIDSLGLNVGLWGRNLTDEEYLTPGLVLYFPGALELTNHAFADPRTYGIDVRYDF